MRNRLRNGGARKSGAMGLRAVKLGYGQADLKRASVSDLSRVDQTGLIRQRGWWRFAWFPSPLLPVARARVILRYFEGSGW